MPDLLNELTERSMRKLDAAQRRRSLPADAMLFIEGETGTSIYRLIDGSIRLFRSTPDGREVTIHLVEPGELFAEIVLFESDTYPVSAVATGDSVVAVIDRDRVLRLLEDSQFRTDFLKNLVVKMRFLSQQLYVLTTMDVRERLCRFLSVRYGHRSRIECDLSKQDTATAISVRPETLSRTLSRLDNEGLLRWKHGVIEVAAAFWNHERDS